MNIYECQTRVNPGHDLTRVNLTVRASSATEAGTAFIRAMTQLGFRLVDYGRVVITPLEQ